MGILKGFIDSYISILTKILNTSLESGCFPNELKLVKVNFMSDLRGLQERRGAK